MGFGRRDSTSSSAIVIEKQLSCSAASSAYAGMERHMVQILVGRELNCLCRTERRLKRRRAGLLLMIASVTVAATMMRLVCACMTLLYGIIIAVLSKVGQSGLEELGRGQCQCQWPLILDIGPSAVIFSGGTESRWHHDHGTGHRIDRSHYALCCPLFPIIHGR